MSLDMKRRTGMPRKRRKPEEIVAKLRRVDVLVSQGQSVADPVRGIGVTEVTYYRWRQEFGGLKRRPHSSLDRRTPDQAYFTALQPIPGCSITMAEIHLAAANRLFKQTEPALISPIDRQKSPH
jgi:hypothetical protein